MIPHQVSGQQLLKIVNFTLLLGMMLGLVGITFGLKYFTASESLSSEISVLLNSGLYSLFFILAVFICVAAWWISSADESRKLAEGELNEQNATLAYEIHERKQTEEALHNRTRELAIHNLILHQINLGVALIKVLDELAHQIEALHPKMVCSILLLDADGKHLHHGAAPSLPDYYNQAIDGMAVGYGVGSCGTAAYGGERIIVEDIQKHPYWLPYRVLACKAGVQSCWSQPIKNNAGLTLGTFAIYHHQPTQPSNTEIMLIERYADLALLAIEHDRAEADLRIAATAFESQEATSITDAQQIIIKINTAFTKITGYSAEEVIGQTHALLKSGRQDDPFYKKMLGNLSRDGFWQGEIWNRRKNGEIYLARVSINAVSDKDNLITHYVTSFSDITKIKEAEETIRNLAYYDPLTQLPNRRLLLERLKHGIDTERREGKQLALLMLDLDRFKIINDSLGHPAGDELLQQVAKRIQARLRDVDTVARLGGDEFIILLENIAHIEDAARVAEVIVADVNKPFKINQSEDVRIGASIGISLYPLHGDSPEQLMEQADIALYQAKDAGRGCFAYFSEDLTLATRKRIEFESRLRKAIEQQNLRVLYQPQVDIASGRIVGAEALVRWECSSEGLISPDRFIPIAEETGLIMAIGEWVLRETCRQGRQWLHAGLPPLTLAVNVSTHQLRRCELSSLVARVLFETGFPPEYLELELTESGLMENQVKVMELLNNLRTQGVRLAIDDFGTGYSSLARIKRFPLDVLKIDKTFIDDIPHNQDDMEITATIVAMGHILGLKVLAEGVETSEQLAFLKEKGCDSYQGYIKSKPVTAEIFAELLFKQQREDEAKTNVNTGIKQELRTEAVLVADRGGI
jgi:diguanylate cyclase (GGDEF)-like protein/PAS domain S-box-containing protein